MNENNSVDKTQDDEKLKEKLITIFVNKNNDVCGDIKKAIDSGDIKLAHRLAHSLKGSAGIHGKTRLQKAAGDVENLLKEENPHHESAEYQSAMIVLKAELDTVLEEFTPLVVEEAPPLVSGTSMSAIDRKKVLPLLEELETMLGGGSLESLKLAETLGTIPGADGVPLIRKLIQQIEYFEFDKTLETLTQLKKEMRG
jgi:HPt (histidine-containing phosphotransfer) domain-containing protein